ncbi:RidA family protein [Rhodobacteraceae bacterium F11138]|nr:RidA family protein [Rhodobacteraceae bacterium F11138]
MRPSKIELFDEPEPGALRPFSRVCKAGGMIYVSGHSAPHDPDAGIYRGETPAEEVRNAIGYIKTLLAQAGSDIDHVVQVTMLITDPADYHALNAEYVKHFPRSLPARHTARFGVPTQARVGFACVALVAEPD